MSDTTFYRLDNSTVIEPLVNRWVAWPHVLSPVPYSLHLQNYQLGLLRSYLEDPKVHAQACRNPKLRCGAFIDIPEERAPEVAAFLARTEISHSENLKLAHSLIEFHNYLIAEAKGQCLEPYYVKVPHELRGYVELIYDYYNRPTVRCLEGMLYESPYYNKELQSFRLFRLKRDDGRAFFMNTPRLPAADQIEWSVPFDSPLVDELFRLERAPQPLGYIRELLGLKPDADDLLRPLLTSAAAPARPPAGEGIRVRYFGHACVLVEWNGVSILVDPSVGVMTDEGVIPRYTYHDLPARIDYVLVTHGHQDHFCVETLLRLRHRIGCLVVPRSFGVHYGDISLKTMARKLGFKDVVELDTFESIPLPDGAIVAIPFMGEHADLPHGKAAYVVRAGTEQILFGADSDCLDRQMYEHVYRVLGAVQTVFIGLECVGAPLSWSCGSFLPVRPEFSYEQSRRYKGCDAARAQTMLNALGAERLYIYAMGLEPWLEYLLGLALTEDSPQITEAKKLLAAVRDKGYEEAKLLFGQDEIHLRSFALDRQPVAALAYAAETADAEDQFQFD
jgi:L-ascorbate metabolism protein UlaG (beta-lactamase superfamily)